MPNQQQPGDKRTALGVWRWLLVLFGALLFLPGVFGLVQFLLLLPNPETTTTQLLATAAGGLLLSLLGGAIVAGTFSSAAYFRRAAQLARTYPDAPWKHDPDWENGVVASKSSRLAIGLGVLALLCNALTIPIGLALVPVVFEEQNYAAAFGFIFPLAGLALLAWAALETVRALVFGRSELRIDSGRGIIGQGLTGTVRNRRRIAIRGEFVITLKCVRVVKTGSGDSSSTHTTELWAGSQTVPGGSKALHTGLPVRLKIPAGLPGSGKRASGADITWTLELAASALPLPFFARFDLPVFQ